MKRLQWIAVWAGSIGVVIGACGDGRGGNDEGAGPGGITMSASGVTDTETATDSVGEEAETGVRLDLPDGDEGPVGCAGGDLGCTDQIDLLFVIDNSGTMAVEQENLARNFPLLIQQLEGLTDSAGNPVMPDVQVMVTTSDFGNPLCTPFEPADYTPARGAPISTPCTQRLERFTGLGTNPEMVPQACTNVCPNDVAPEGNFIAFSPVGDNIPDDVVPVDIDGDGVEDSPIAQALACIGPQGIDGCGYESQLENMLQALNPGAMWNQGADAFLRPNALLAVAIVTDEADCSVKDYTIMEDEAYQEIDPDDMEPAPSSAICWNAGVSCNGPDANGVYSDCTSINDNDALQPINRYTNYLINELRENQRKEVVMLGILGVPEVTAHNDNAPFEPTAGGVMDLVYRNWEDGEYPGGDILPTEFAGGTTAADKQADFGIGPGCTGGDAVSGFTGQAIPPVRIKEVCEALNIENADGSVDVRCCIESICDDDFSAAIRCLTGIIGEAIQPPG
jgi:hypothetical protein